MYLAKGHRFIGPVDGDERDFIPARRERIWRNDGLEMHQAVENIGSCDGLDRPIYSYGNPNRRIACRPVHRSVDVGWNEVGRRIDVVKVPLVGQLGGERCLGLDGDVREGGSKQVFSTFWCQSEGIPILECRELLGRHFQLLFPGDVDGQLPPR